MAGLRGGEEAKRRNLDLIIVTGDEKEDWWWRHRSVVIGPRHEMAKEFFDFSGGRQLFLLRPRDLLLRSSALDVEVNPASLEDAGRQRDDLDPVGVWTAEAVAELLRRLDAEGQVQADVIREAAALGGTIGREALYGICGYDDDRMLRGFTRPTARITTDLQLAGLLPDPVAPALKPLYPEGVRAAGFRIPAEVAAILRGTAGVGDDEPDAEPDGSSHAGGKYTPLTRWLQEQTADTIPVTFADLEGVIEKALAPWARHHLPYWYSVRNSLGRAIAAGGFRPRQVDLTSETLTLVRR
ncbi:PIN-like domain-containing protein [Micromonospora purpureochromogenes]|uniref:PIN-like domain-containing protein n=1 Tax=Micromonospora purpureochromogenes TaxID=47872 RepID=UPI0033E56BC9